VKKFLIVALLLMGAACDSSEERAEAHFETASEYLEEGDLARALIELRNTLKLNGKHHDALLAMAEIRMEQGNTRGALNHYRRLVETFPDDPDGNREMARLAFQSSAWNDAERYASKAQELTPDDPRVAEVTTALAYREASLDKNEADQAQVAQQAQALIETTPDLEIARNVVLADLLRQQKFSAALEVIDTGIALHPQARDLYTTRLSLLAQLGDKRALEAQLKNMIDIFPDDPNVEATLVRWYISEQRIDEAEAWLRGRIDPAASEPEPRLTLIRFLSELRGTGQALQELETVMAETPLPADVAADANTFEALRAGFLFNTGKAAEAAGAMRALIASYDGQTPEGAELAKLNRYKVSLSRMQASTGNQVAARALVEEVLLADPSDVEALKLKSRWQVLDDQTADAIINLRQALSEAPRDAEIMTLLASAYEREGNRELMTEMLSLAVEASNRAPEASLRYANLLAQQEKFRAAEEVLINALRLAPNDVSLLGMLGRVHLAMQDWARATQDVERLKQFESDQAQAIANELQAQLLAGQRKTDDLTTFLEQIGTGDISSAAAVIRVNLLSGRTDVALERSAQLIEAHPDDPSAGFIRGLVLTIAGRYDEGIPLLEKMAETSPEVTQVWTSLYNAYLRNNQPEKAREALDRAVAAKPEDMDLQWVKAGAMEQNGDIEGAIAIYEDLYARNSTAVVIANNLASLLTTYRDDAESLERAYTVARRLRGVNVPAFQDTYGWIAFRRGDAQEALTPMEAAAKGLPNDPTVRYHLAEVYAALGRTEEARAAYDKARELLETGDIQPPGLASRISEGRAKLAATPQGE
jgi:tetratricopeptide (TPR) repeat protein